MTAPPAIGRDLPRLTSLRIFAALAVFMFHIGHNTTWGPGGITFLHGFVGVAFFFVLSGFVLTWSTRPTMAPREFWLRRFARIYPSHLAVMLITFGLPVLAYPITPGAVAANVLLVQAWFPQWPIAFGMNAVSWSLSCEFFFYLVAPFVIRWGHRQSNPVLIAALLGWFAITSAAALALGFGGTWDVYAFTNPLIRSGEFGLGVAAALLASRGRLPRIPVTVGVAAVALAWLATNARQLPQSVTDVIFTVPFLILVMAAATTDLSGRIGLLSSRPLVYAGQVSFAFYLVHELVILNGEPLWGGWATSTPTALLLVAGVFALSFGFAAALHHLVELPCQRWLRSLGARRPSAARR